MNHAEVHSYMADYLEGDLDLTKRALLDAHLDGCNDCSHEFAQMRGTIGLLRGLPSPEAPPFLVEKVMRRIRDGEGEQLFLDRLREWIASVATPRVALPATALGLGLLMASGNLDFRALWSPERSAPIGAPLSVVSRPPHLSVSGRPPAVGRSPGIRIMLPAPATSQIALNNGGPAPFHNRRAARSIRSVVPQRADSSIGLSTPVATRVGSEMTPPHPSAFAADDAMGMSEDELRVWQLDEQLDRMIRAPSVVAADFASYSEIERELWLSALAERARHTGRGEETLAVLRDAGDRSALKLATALSVELQRAKRGRTR